MNIVTPTKLIAAPLAGRLNFPKHSLTWIVKGTFDLKSNGPAVLAETQAFPTGDEFYPGDEEKSGSVRYESDFAYLKPRADLLLVGAAYAPGGKPTPVFPATFRVGNKTKTVGVIGPRRWEKQWLTWKATEPEPITRMELRYENSFGGAKSPANPAGKGSAEIPDGAAGKLWPLPNIEDPSCLIESHGQRPAPAGFGPLSRAWTERHGKLGTYKGEYRKTRWPWFPEDFDWTHFNAAPSDMQLEGHLRGDETLTFDNLHPQLAHYESKLPGLRVRAFVHRLTGATTAATSFDEVEMKLDTLWVDMETQKLVLVWRGSTEVSSEDHEEIQDFYYATEPVTQPPAPAARYHRDFLATKAAVAKPFEPETPPPLVPPEKPEDPASAEAAAAGRKKERDETIKQLEAQTAALNAELGLEKLSPQAQAQARATQTKLIEHLAEKDPAKIAGFSNNAVRADLKTALEKIGLDPDNLPPPTEKARAEQLRLLNELGFKGTDLQADPHLAELGALMGAALGQQAGMSPENLEPAIAEARKLKAKLGIVEPPPPPPPAPVPPLTREALQAKLAAQESLEGVDLRGQDFSNQDLRRADFAGANLAGVPFRGTKLQQANLSKANLTGCDLSAADLSQANAAGADFSGAKMPQTVLKGADLTGAKLGKADLTKAVLDGALLEEADLRGACGEGSSAIRTNFARADLTGANFKKCHCPHADFAKAQLGQADFSEANLTEACLIGVVGRHLNLTRATLTKVRANGGGDFTGAKLVEAQGNGSMWKEANLTGADLRFAQLEEALFTSANLKQANLSAANLKQARFNKANLREAKLVRVNLFQGNLERSDLTQADLSGSNLYEAELLDAKFDRTVADGANLKMTKLEPV